MGRVDDIARRFSLAGVLDDDRLAKERFPVEEVEVADIADHPDNVAYSMDEAGIRALADSIAKDGLTDIPLVRRLDDGGLQMVSGHRRKAAYALLAESDPAYAKMPCRIVAGIDDDQARVLLHAANYFTRKLSVVEQARATQALGLQVKRMREEDPGLKGTRSADLKAAIIRAQTGRDIAPRTIEHHERIARTVEAKLVPEWQARAEAGELTDRDIGRLAKLGADKQAEIAAAAANGAEKASASALIKEAADEQKAAKRRGRKPKRSLRGEPDELLAQALSALQAAHAAIAAGGAFDVAKLAAVEEEAAAIRRLG